MSLVRDPDAISIFADAAVFIAASATPTVPATIAAAFDSTWDNLGVLNGDSGITRAREWDETENFGWGIGLYRIGRKNYKESGSVTCLEKNTTTELLAHGTSSSATAQFVNRGVRRKLAFEFTDDFGVKERLFTASAADLWIPNLDRNESDPSGREVTYRVFADGTGKLYNRQFSGVSQTVTILGGPAGGTFTLSYQGQTTTGLAPTVASAAVQTALEGLSTIGTGNAVVTGSAGGPFTITKLEYPLGANGSGLTGGTSPSVVVART